MRARWIRALILVVVLVGGVITPVAPVGEAQATPSGFVTIPDANVHEDLPVDQSLSISKEDLEGSVMVSDNASTTEIVVTTSERSEGYLDNGTSIGGGSLALVIQDDTNHAGREVAIPADAVKGAIGRIPEAVHGRHEDGSEWTSQVRAESGLLIFEVPHFSSNTVTFSGNVSVTGTYTDGSSVSYEVSSLDSVSNFSVNVAGEPGTDTDTEFVSAVPSDGGSIDLSVAGNLNPSGPESGDPRISVTDQSGTTPSYDTLNENGWSPTLFGEDASGNLYKGEVRVNQSPSGFSEITLNLENAGSATVGVDIYVVEETPDQTAGEGTLVKSNWNPPTSTGNTTIQLDSGYQPSNPGEPITIEFVTVSGPNDGSYHEWLAYNSDYSVSNTTVAGYDGSSWSTDDSPVNLWLSSNPPDGLSVSADTGESATLGDFTQGETKTAALSLTNDSSSVSLSATSGGAVDMSVEYIERSETIDPVVEINGQTTSYPGNLSDGETVTLTANESWIQSGTNIINVSVGDGSLSADAPTPAVNLNYRHEATDEISVSYSADGWTERYNTSRTFASTQDSPTVSVPFQGDVTEITRLEERTDGGSWSSVPSSRYSLDGSQLTVQLDDGDGDGDVDAGTNMSVRATGRYVDPVNGAITVTDPILPGEDADVEFRIDSMSSGFYVDLSGVSTPGVRYTYQESWSNPDSHMIVTASGEKRLKFPNAPEGGSARVTLVPLTVAPETGEAKVSVADPDEPTISLEPGATNGDDVTIRYLEASTGTTYQLYSTSRDRIVAKETADAGTVSFVEDDSTESLLINTSSSGGGAGGMFGDASAPTDYGVERPVLVMGALAALVIGLVWATGRTGIRGRQRWVLVGGVSLALGLLSLESLNPGSISRFVGESIGSVLPLAGIGAVVIVGYTVVSWWQSRKQKAETPETKVTFSLGDRKK